MDMVVIIDSIALMNLSSRILVTIKIDNSGKKWKRVSNDVWMTDYESSYYSKEIKTLTKKQFAPSSNVSYNFCIFTLSLILPSSAYYPFIQNGASSATKNE